MLIFIGLFISTLIAQSSGYYTTKIAQEKVLTEEEIKKFEEDIKNGKDIDISVYTNNYKKYDTELSTGIYNASLKLEQAFNFVIQKIFSAGANLVTG